MVGCQGTYPLFTNHALGHFQTKPVSAGSNQDDFWRSNCKLGHQTGERQRPSIWSARLVVFVLCLFYLFELSDRYSISSIFSGSVSDSPPSTPWPLLPAEHRDASPRGALSTPTTKMKSLSCRLRITTPKPNHRWKRPSPPLDRPGLGAEQFPRQLQLLLKPPLLPLDLEGAQRRLQLRLRQSIAAISSA